MLSALGSYTPSNIELSLKAVLVFFGSSSGFLPLLIASAVSVSTMSYKVWRSESPGKRGYPLVNSAKIQPTAHTSMLAV